MSSISTHAAMAADPCLMAEAVNHPPEFWQQRLLRSTARRIAVVAARQVGKSAMISMITLHEATFRSPALIPIISSRQDAANEFLLRVRTWARMLGIPVEGEATTSMRFGNGSRVLALPSTIDTVRGYSSARLIVIDEASFVGDDVFAAIVPRLAADGRLIALCTPAPTCQRRNFANSLGRLATLPRQKEKKGKVAHELDLDQLALLQKKVGSRPLSSPKLPASQLGRCSSRWRAARSRT